MAHASKKRARVVNPRDDEFDDVVADNLAVGGYITVGGTGTFTGATSHLAGLTSTTVAASGLVSGDGVDGGTGDIGTGGVLRGNSLNVNSGTATIANTGTFTTPGAVNANSLDVNTGTATISSAGAVVGTSVNAGAGAITTTGTLGSGAATVTSLNAGSGLIQTTGTVDANAANFGSTNQLTISSSGVVNSTALVDVAADINAGTGTGLIKLFGSGTAPAGRIGTNEDVVVGLNGHTATPLDYVRLAQRLIQIADTTSNVIGQIHTANGFDIDQSGSSADDLVISAAGGILINADAVGTTPGNGIGGFNDYMFRVGRNLTTATIDDEPQIRVHPDGYFVVPKSSGNPSTSEDGAIYYNTTSNELRYHNGTSWVAI